MDSKTETFLKDQELLLCLLNRNAKAFIHYRITVRFICYCSFKLGYQEDIFIQVDTHPHITIKKPPASCKEVFLLGYGFKAAITW